MVTVATKFGLRHVVAAGVIGGLIFAMFEMLAAALLQGLDAVFMPLRMIGGIVLGSAALDPTYSLLVAALVGVIVHLVLSIGFAFIFAAIVSPTASEASLAGAGALFGTVLWLINFYVIAPIAGWTWFQEASVIVQFLAHAFFFGCPLGWYLARSRTIVVRPTP